MPLYMDIHELHHGETAEDVAKAHHADTKIQDKYGVKYSKYWVNEGCGKVFCLCEAPNEEAANQVHREAHGLVADKLIEVQPELVEGFLGRGNTNSAGAALLPGGTDHDRDTAIRTVLFTDIVGSTSLTQKLGDDRAMELHLDRALQEKRLYPAIHPLQSATRREELLYHPDEWDRVQLLRKTMAALPPIEAMEKLIENLEATKTNAELLLSGLK